MGKAPAFQFYASDFLTDTQSWEVEEVGIYIRLLANEWVNGPLPNDEKRLARIAGCDVEDFKNHWVILGFKFLPNEGGMLYNERLEDIRAEQEAKRLKNALNGAKGGRPRKEESETKPKDNPTVNPEQTQTKALHSSTSSIINKEKGEGHFFYVNGEVVKSKPSERLLNEHSYSLEQLMMGVFRGLRMEDILKRLDEEYSGYQFKDEMHLRNSFKSIGEKILKEKTAPKKNTFNQPQQPEAGKSTLGAKPRGAVNHGG